MLTQPSTDRARLIAWVAVIVLTTWLVFIGGGAAATLDPRLRMVSQALIGAVLAAWALVAIRRPGWRPRSVFLPGLAVGLGAFAVSTAFAPRPRLGVEYLAYAFLLVLLYLLLVRLLADPWFRSRVLALTATLAVVIGVLYVAIVVASWIEWWGLIGRIAAPPLRPSFAGMTWANPSAVLAMSALLTATAAASIGFAGGRRRTLVVALVGLSLLVAVLSGSRGGGLAIAAGLLVAGIGAFVAADMRSVVAEALRSRAVRAGALVAAVPVAAVVLLLAPGIIFRATSGGEDLRGTFVAIAVRQFGDSPLVGSGPGSWVAGRIAATEAGEPDYYIPHAHNLYAQVLAEFGVVGAVAGLIVIWFVGRLVVAAIRSADPTRRRFGWASAAAITYLAVHQVFDLYANLPAVLFALAVPIAWLDATAPRASRAEPPRVDGAVPLLGLVAVGALLALEQPAAAMADAVAHANRGDWAAADALARDGVARDPDMPPYQLTAGVAAARVGDDARAVQHLRSAANADDLPAAWLGLAAAEARLGNVDEARRVVPRALRLGIQQPAIAMAAGDLLLRLGEVDAAIDAFAAAIVRAPSIAGDPWWQSRPDAAAVLPRVLDSVGAGTSFEIALATDDADRARAIADARPDGDGDLIRDVARAWFGDDAALGRLRAAALARPLDVTVLTWLARVEAHLGNDDEAARYRDSLEVIVGLSSLATARLRVQTAELPPIRIAGTETNFFGIYTYRRATPWDVIPPGLVHLSYE